MFDFDLLVIGSGPSGQRAAVQAAKLGKRVALCENNARLGGVCMNTGTIPSKTFREAVLHLTGLRQRQFYGQSYHVKENVTIADLIQHCDHVLKTQGEVVRDQLRRNGITVLRGLGRFTGPNEVQVQGEGGDSLVSASFIVLATGTTAAHPPDVEVDGQIVITSDNMFGLHALPRTMTVVGAGVIGVEYASMFAALGVKVTLVDKRHRLLDFVDSEIAESLSYQLRDMGATLRLGEEVAKVQVEASRAVATLKSGKKIASDVLLYSVGRVGTSDSLQLDKAGLEADGRGRIAVDSHFRTKVPHIYAVGDLIGFPALASTSSEQGRLAACHAFGLTAAAMPELLPYGIYSVPEISMVGRHEEELTAAGVPYETGIARYREIVRGVMMGDDSGLLKLLFHRETRQLLGVHIIGTGATELVHIGQAVIAFGGTIDYFIGNVFNYPTFAECYKVAALDGYNKVGRSEGAAALEQGPVA
ncbi:Si-specific NAD(P)(+) transhydrogenase [Pendulispora albinea]|uniref:Soluble pyridine nucleotide transhydrogenase n=1 Tax=Pendulispora albinea TaxID=2741071 RepID=A0ABZ2LSV7_9BACT